MMRYLDKYKLRLSVVAAVWLFLFAAGAALADNSKISPDLLPLLNNPGSQINVIVQYTSPPQQQPPQQQTCSGGGLLGGLLCGVTGVVTGVVGVVGGVLFGLLGAVLGLINGIAGTLTPDQVIAASNQSNVAYISLDRPVSPMLDYSAAAVNAQYAWSSSLDGSGVGIAIIDSGIDSHPDLDAKYSNSSRVVYRQSFVKGVQFDDYGQSPPPWREECCSVACEADDRHHL
jgi:subtilisin family serine protease